MFVWHDNQYRESDAPAELCGAATGRPQTMGTVIAAAKSAAGAFPTQPVFSLVKMQTKMSSEVLQLCLWTPGKTIVPIVSFTKKP